MRLTLVCAQEEQVPAVSQRARWRGKEQAAAAELRQQQAPATGQAAQRRKRLAEDAGLAAMRAACVHGVSAGRRPGERQQAQQAVGGGHSHSAVGRVGGRPAGSMAYRGLAQAAAGCTVLQRRQGGSEPAGSRGGGDGGGSRRPLQPRQLHGAMLVLLPVCRAVAGGLGGGRFSWTAGAGSAGLAHRPAGDGLTRC